MIYHGDWERYTPDPLPEGWPEWASYARRVSDGVDWYQWTREHWNVQNGADTTGTMKVQVVGNVAISKCPDVTGLGFASLCMSWKKVTPFPAANGFSSTASFKPRETAELRMIRKTIFAGHCNIGPAYIGNLDGQ